MKYKLLFLLFICFATKQVCCQTLFKPITGKTVFAKPVSVSILPKPIAVISPSMMIKPSFYCNNLGFFCKQEIKIQKIIKLPFVFRIGSVQEVDYLEGKRGSAITTR
jgi:hypothetical protein